MDKTVKVSILIPVYNAEKYLGKCLDSVFSQTYSPIEYVIVDNCSTDNSLTILDNKISQYGISKDCYKIIRHEKNEGIAVSRNDCITNATGEYVLFVDSDDWIENDMVEQLVSSTASGSIDIVGCNFFQEKPDGTQLYVQEPFANNCRDNMIKALDYEISSVLWKLLIRRSLFDNIHFTPHLDIVEDYIVTIKLYQYAKSFAAVHKGLYHYIIYQNSTSNKRLNSIESHIKGVSIVEDYLKREGLYEEEIEQKLLLRKFNIKSNFLTKSLLDYNAYRQTFPEANRMWRKMNYSRKEKLKFWLAEKGLFSLLKLMQDNYGAKH